MPLVILLPRLLTARIIKARQNAREYWEFEVSLGYTAISCFKTKDKDDADSQETIP